jgi:hypothetical protein
MIEHKESRDSFEDIREMSKEILKSSLDLVEVSEAGIEEILVPRIKKYLEEVDENAWLPEGHDLSLENECGLNLFIDVINFCYKDPETGHEYFFTAGDGKRIKRATGLTAALARSGFDWNDFASVSEISVERWREMLQLSGENQMYLGDERRDKIVGFARFLLSRGLTNVPEFIDGCDYDAGRMTVLLNESGYFEDRFMKRSQLACRMINDVLVRRGELSLTKIDRLTVMADYRIPQVFYNLGAVSLIDKDMTDRILNGTSIPAGSREENALRATAVHVGKIVADRLGISEAEADNVLWGLSQEMVRKGEMAIPHMIVATDAY